MNKAILIAQIAVLSLAVLALPAGAADPEHLMIDHKYFKCEQSRNLQGGIYGKGPFKKFGPEQAVCSREEWVEVTKAEFKALATEWYGHDWSGEIPFWQGAPGKP